MFGSTVYIHVPRDERGKLDPKTKKCILHGYGNVQKGYRVYDHVTQKVSYSRNVKFDEREMEGLWFEEEGPVNQPIILDPEKEAESDEGGIEEEVETDADPPAAEPHHGGLSERGDRWITMVFHKLTSLRTRNTPHSKEPGGREMERSHGKGDEVSKRQRSLGADFTTSREEGNRLQVGVQGEDKQ